MVTQKDIADKCNVSVSAVSAAFNRPEHISRETRERILEAARDMGYFLDKLEIKNIGLVFNDFFNHYFSEFYGEIIYGVLERLSELKLRSQIFNHLPDKYHEICEINGFLVIGNDSTPLAYKIKEQCFPYVLIDCTRKLSGPHNLIYFANMKEAQQLAEFIINCGHRNVAIINGETDPQDISWINFQKGVNAAFLANKLPRKNLQVYQADYGNIQTLEIAVNRILSEKKRITCIMCSNDWFAYHTYQILDKYSKKIPRDISVTGFDGITAPSLLKPPSPKLTTVFADRTDLGRRAVDFLIDTLQNPREPRTITVKTKFRAGDSVRRI